MIAYGGIHRRKLLRYITEEVSQEVQASNKITEERDEDERVSEKSAVCGHTREKKRAAKT